MKKLIDHGPYYNPYLILDEIADSLLELGLHVDVTEDYKQVNVYKHKFTSGRFECIISNSRVSSTEFDIYIRVYIAKPDSVCKILFDRNNYNLGVKSLRIQLLKDIEYWLVKYVDDLESNAQRVVKINSIVNA